FRNGDRWTTAGSGKETRWDACVGCAAGVHGLPRESCHEEPLDANRRDSLRQWLKKMRLECRGQSGGFWLCAWETLDEARRSCCSCDTAPVRLALVIAFRSSQ